MTSELNPSAPSVGQRKAWIAPSIQQLPPLVSLTLATGPAINGSGGAGGVTFSLLTGRRTRLG